MQIPLIDLKRQFQYLKQDVLAKCEEIMSGASFIMGEEVFLFEQEFAALVGAKHAVSCNSGTDALMLILEALGIGPGDEVLTSPFTFFSTAECISRMGAVPVFVDVDAGTMNMDPDKLEAAITSKTKAVLAVHIFGQPADMESIVVIAHKHGLPVIEDACQAVGASYTFADGTVKQVGTIGDAAAFSFFPTKNLGAYGDGGMVTTNDDKIAQVVRALRVHGSGFNGKSAYEYLYHESVELQVSADTGANSTVYDPTKYFNFLIGGNSRLDTVQAGILRIKMKYLPEWNEKRRRLAARYTEKLGALRLVGSDYVMPQKILPQVTPVYHLYLVVCERREELQAYLREQGIAVGIYYPVPLHLQQVYQRGKYKLPYKEGDLPHSEWLSRRTMALPLFPEMTEAEQDYVVNAVKEFYQGRG